MADDDLSESPLAPTDKGDVNGLLEDNTWARRFRVITYAVIGILTLATYAALMKLLWSTWEMHGTLAAAGAPVPHSIVVMFGLSVFALGAIGLSLTMALIRLSERHRQERPTEQLPFTTPLLELVRAAIKWFERRTPGAS